MSGWDDVSATIGFRLDNLTMRFVLPIPPMSDDRFRWRSVRGRKVRATDNQAMNRWEQEQRSRWRALQLVVKAKLEAVECGISTMEQEFLAFIVLPTKVTLGDYIIENVLPSIKLGRMPLALTGKKEDVQDAEIVKP
jgi:hypothetical protein